MRKVTATEASRGFSDLLDAIEDGETVLVTRGNRTIAQISPAPTRTGRDLREALARVPVLDAVMERDIAAATGSLTRTVDPWAGV